MGPGGLPRRLEPELRGSAGAPCQGLGLQPRLGGCQTLGSTTNLKTPHNKLCIIFPRIRYLPYRPDSFIKEADKFLVPIFPSQVLKNSEKCLSKN